jgi:FlaA1/EpsC-like NDP-sugar epimerase
MPAPVICESRANIAKTRGTLYPDWISTMPRKADNHNWENFLGRRPLESDAARLQAHHEGKTVLVTGAGGSIGSALALKIASSAPQLVLLLENNEHNLYQIQTELARLAYGAPFVSILGDIADRPLLDTVLAQYRPDIIYHAAAFKHVPLMEANPLAAVQNNALGTHALAHALAHHGAGRLLMISTDKAVDPQNVMGASKRLAEIILQTMGNENTRMNCIRLGNVLGSQGSVGQLFLQQISRGGPVTITNPEATRYFLTLEEAVGLVLTGAALDSSNSVWVTEPGPPHRILALAEYLIHSAGLTPFDDIPIAFTGLRPGDKLAEQMVSKSETVEPGPFSGLQRVQGPPMSQAEMEGAVSELREVLKTRNLPALTKSLCRIIPEYQPSEGLLELTRDSAYGTKGA